MVILLMGLMGLFISSSFSQTPNLPSEKMAQLLFKSQITPFGRKQTLCAQVGCKESKKDGFYCFVKPSGFYDTEYPPSTTSTSQFIYTLEEAQEISKLLSSYGISPLGPRKAQLTEVSCQLSKSTPSLHECQVLKASDFEMTY